MVNSIKTQKFNSQYNDIPVKNVDFDKYINKPKNNESTIPKVDVYKPQTIVISDLHGDMDRWNTIKRQLQYHPNYKFIIEGDAMDRGAFGIDILLEIKELSDSGKVQYLPGNHDIFTYNYLRSQNTNQTSIYNLAVKNLEHNGRKNNNAKFRKF